MLKKLSFKNTVYLSILMAVIESISLLMVPLSDLNGTAGQKIAAYLVAVIFWLSLIFEIVFVYISSKKRRKMEKEKHFHRSGKEMPKRIGLVSFLKNFEASVVDIALFIIAIIVVILTWTQGGNEWLNIIFISLLILSFNLHCILNGKNYAFLKSYIK